MLTSLFQELGFRNVELESAPTKQGPFSWSNPIIDEPPGPPFNQIDRGALTGSLRASKNQKKLSSGFKKVIQLRENG
jgi:hypothetical protein